MIKKISILLLLLLSYTLLAVSVSSVRDAFFNQEYNKVISLTSGDLKGHGSEELTLYRAKSFYELKNYKNTANTTKEFLKKYPYSEYKDYAILYLALAEYNLENIEDAVYYLSLLKSSKYQDIRSSSDSILKYIVEKSISRDNIDELTEKVFDEETLDLLNQQKNNLNILIVLPFSGRDKKAGTEIYKGIKFYFERKEEKFSKKIRIDVCDSQSDIVKMQKNLVKKLKTKNYDLIIGELVSDRTASLAGIASVKNIPVLAPTASDDDIYKISENVYQLNSTSKTMGEKIAEFAIDSLGYQTFATIIPVTNDGKEAEKGFSEAVERLGAEIVSREWYYSSTDMSKQFSRIREFILSQDSVAIRDSIMDSLDVEAYMEEDSIKTIPVGYIDAFFIPMADDEFDNVAPQYAFYNFKGKLLGTYAWDDPRNLKKYGAIVDSIVYVTENTFNTNDYGYIVFVEDFRKKFKRNPNKLEIIGYDTINLVMSVLRNNPEKSLTESLKGLERFNGISGPFTFEEGNRTNRSVKFYRFKRFGGIEELK